jgi:hypothetical protein
LGAEFAGGRGMLVLAARGDIERPAAEFEIRRHIGRAERELGQRRPRGQPRDREDRREGRSLRQL